ncbi:MAG: hypothetical protein IJE22_02180 [Oscillibacter sp.]|nr:hypothetical protein [Oscillibacter sp.]
MSGSSIIRNDKQVGTVIHVLVNDSAKECAHRASSDQEMHEIVNSIGEKG